MDNQNTLIAIGTDIKRKQLGYLQLPVRIKGLQEGFEEEKIIFR